MANKHWLHLMRPNLRKHVEMGLYLTGLVPQSHCKFISRSQQGQIGSKQLKISCFWRFFYNYVHFSCLWWLETHLDPNTDLYQNTSKDYRIIIKGLEGLYPIDTNTWWHGLGLGFIKESAQGFCEVRSEHNCSKSITLGYPKVMAMSKYNISVLFYLFLSYQTVLSWGWFEGDLKKTLQPLCYPCNPSGVIWCRSVLGSRHVSSHHINFNWTKC